jgi:hypothetical protein
MDSTIDILGKRNRLLLDRARSLNVLRQQERGLTPGKNDIEARFENGILANPFSGGFRSFVNFFFMAFFSRGAFRSIFVRARDTHTFSKEPNDQEQNNIVCRNMVFDDLRITTAHCFAGENNNSFQ